MQAQQTLVIRDRGSEFLILKQKYNTIAHFMKKKEWEFQSVFEWSVGPRQANLVLIAYASSEGSGELI